MQRKIIHVDMDCFYAAIEMRDNPELRNKPIAVGGDSPRGVLCTSNYIARNYGVRSAMSATHAKKLCPELLILKPDMNKYREVSHAIRKIFLDYTELVEPLSLDEAYLDVSDSDECNGIATKIAKEIRQRILQEQQLTASAGIAPNKFLAKIASDWQKPNDQFVITPNKVDLFIEQLPIKKIFGVGKVTAKKLTAMGINTCADLQTLPLEELIRQFGRFGERLFYLCRGVDDRCVETSRERKSLSVEHTFNEDITSIDVCMNSIKSLYAELQQRLAKHKNLTIHKQFVKIKFNNFQQTTVESTCDQPFETAYQQLCRKGLLRQPGRPIRLLGLGVGFKVDSNLSVTEPQQLGFDMCG